MGSVLEKVERPKSAAQIWDLICGLTDEQPSQPALTDAISHLLRDEIGAGARSILDLGGGSGGAAIGLAALGHQVVVVDIDPWMVSKCRFRLQRTRLPGTVLQADFRDLTAEYLADRAPNTRFDALICLGNALGYQDSWPSNQPSHALTPHRLGGALQNWMELLQPSGVVVLELAVEDISKAPYRYKTGPVRCLQLSNGNIVESSWVVEVRADGTRSADTVLYCQSADPIQHTVMGKCLYHGHAVSWELLQSAADIAGLQLVPQSPLRAIPLACCVLRRAD